MRSELGKGRDGATASSLFLDGTFVRDRPEDTESTPTLLQVPSPFLRYSLHAGSMESIRQKVGMWQEVKTESTHLNTGTNRADRKSTRLNSSHT